MIEEEPIPSCGAFLERVLRSVLGMIAVCALMAGLLSACDPLAPVPTLTPQVIIVTPAPTATPPVSPTPPPTATLAAPTSTPSPTPARSAFACETTRTETIAFDTFASEVAGENLPYRVVIPPCYLESGQRYPVVYLLHGLNYDELQWSDIGVARTLEAGLADGTLPPMILVMPDFGSLGAENIFPPEPSYETVFREELQPAIERDFCTVNTRDFRALGGISRGGFWAYSIGMRHPEAYGILGGHSAAFDPNNAPDAFNPLELALNAADLAAADLRMYLDNAAADPAGRYLELFSSRLSSRGIPHQYVINPSGNHDNAYWNTHVGEYLAFYGRDWPRDAALLPSCAEPSP